MDNLWLLTEERPKPSVVDQIVDMYCRDFGDRITVHNEIKIKPIIIDGVFKFVYQVEGLAVAGAADIFIKTVSGSSSFLDFLLFKQEKAPTEGDAEDNLIMAIEETKTSDDESRNTGVYQRGSKFVYITPYYQNAKLYIEQEYIYPRYGDVTIMRCVSIFGENCVSIPHEKVLFYLADDGRIIINENAPQCIKRCFAGTGVRI